MTFHLTKESKEADVILFLEENNFEESVIDVFRTNEVDGEDFFDLDLCTINSFVPKLKSRKKFISAWTKEIHMTFDVNGARVPEEGCSTKLCKAEITDESFDKGQEKIVVVSSPRKRKRPSDALGCAEGTLRKSPRRSPHKSLKSAQSSRSAASDMLREKTSSITPRSKLHLGAKKSPVENKDSPTSGNGSPKGHPDGTWLENFTIPTRKSGQKHHHLESSCSQPVQYSKSGKKTRKTQQRKARKDRKRLSKVLKTNAAKVLNEKLFQVENESKNAKQIANGYFYKWKKTMEENKKLLRSKSCNLQTIDIPNCMIIEKDILDIEKDNVIGEGTFGRCFKGKYKGISVCSKFFKEKHFSRSRIESEMKVMLGISPHSSLPLLLGVCLGPDPILVTQFIGFNQEAMTLDNFSKRCSKKWMERCSLEHLFLTMMEGLQAIHHSGYIHNDIKPNNILVELRGCHLNAVIIDFGKSCALHKGIFYKLQNKSEKQTHSKRYPHLAPELVYGDSPQSISTDIYSVGYTVKNVLSAKFVDNANYLKDIYQSCMCRQSCNRAGLNYLIDYLSRKMPCVLGGLHCKI